MPVEARFTVQGYEKEISFSVVEGESEILYLYSADNNNTFKYKLRNEDGLLKLAVPNPFTENDELVEERLIGLSTDWIETRSQGFDNETVSDEIKEPGYGPENIFVENKPFSLRQIVELIDTGDIELTPDFQRNFVWDKTRQCRLIESILIGLPLPSLYLSQYTDGRLTVVDGLQRLSTIRAFMNDDLVLNNLEYLDKCNGKRFSELASVLSPLRIRRFGQTQIMCFVLDYRSPANLKFDLFRRLNTGSKPLNNQEIRNCLSRPAVQDVLREMVNLSSFKEATSNSVRDIRMEAREAALRFIYFSEQYSVENPTGIYNGDMETTLDNFIDVLNNREPESIRQYINQYDRALATAYFLFGAYCFRKVLPNPSDRRKSPVNKLLMLTISVLLSKYDFELLKQLNEEDCLIDPLGQLLETDLELYQMVTYGTNGKRNIEFASRAFKRLLDDNLKVNI